MMLKNSHMKRYISIIIFLTLFIPVSRAQGNIAEADSLYAKGQYNQALQLYEQAERSQGTSAAMLFNMGNAAVRANRYGTAMVAYQRAAALDPGNSRIRNNIYYLLEKVDDRNAAKLGSKKGDVAHPTPSALESLWLAITAKVNPGLWAGIALATFLLCLAGIMVYVLSGNVMLRKGGFFTSFICLALTVICGIFTMTARRHWQHRDTCVVTAFETTPLPKPDEKANTTLTPLVAGTLLTMPETSDTVPAGWVFVRLNDVTSGYVPASDITKL